MNTQTLQLHLTPHARTIGIWLLIVAAMVGAMTVIGGVTRLTESGLSMVEWRPLIGTLPPFSDQEWARVFALYQTSPEYQKINSGMSLAEFKAIFWWEYVHRFWGRIIGLAYAAPLAFFWIKGWIPRALRGRMLMLLALGGSQGVIGWWMVKSGLVDRPDVSHFRLAIHLGMAFVIAGALVWTALDFLLPRPQIAAPIGMRKLGWGVLVVLFVVIILGAFVAGTNAGMIYNTFPLMDGRLLPPDYSALSPWWRNGLESIGAIQFHHRWAAILTSLLIIALWLRARSLPADSGQRSAPSVMALLVIIQVMLGIATLLTVVWIPLAALHQAVALLLFLSAVWTVWVFRGQTQAHAAKDR
jgi:cytochrome c oxidase assembly protein subunit 15